MISNLIIRQPLLNDVILNLQNGALTINSDGATQALCQNCSGNFDATCGNGGTLYIVYSDDTYVYLAMYENSMWNIKLLDIPKNCSNFQTIFINDTLYVSYVLIKPKGSTIYLHNYLTTTSILIDNCSSVPYSLCICKESYNINILYTTSKGDLCCRKFDTINGILFEITVVDTSLYGISFPHVLNYNGMHGVYNQHSKSFGTIMYLPPNGNPRPIYKGCSLKAHPLIYREGEDIKIIWYEYNRFITVDTILLKTQELPPVNNAYHIIRLRIPDMLTENYLSEIYAFTNENKIKPLVCTSLFDEPIIESEGLLSKQFDIPIMQKEPPQDLELEKIKIRIKLLEDYVYNNRKDVFEPKEEIL